MTAKTFLICAALIASASAFAQTNKMSKDEYRRWYAEQQARDAVAKANWKKRHAVAQTAVYVSGKVIQNIDDGLLLDCDLHFAPSSNKYRYDIEHNHKWAYSEGFVLLTGHPDKSTIVDDDLVSIVAFPIGKYEYTSVNNSKKTILKFTANLDEAVNYWSSIAVADSK